MPGQCIRLACAVAVALAPAATFAQAVPDPVALHRSALDIYMKTADVTRAVAPLQQMKQQDYDRAVEALVAGGDEARIRAAAILHLDIAVAVVGLAPGTAKFHLDIGDSLGGALEDLRKRGARVDELVEFRSMWLSVAGSVFLAVKDVQRALPYVRHAMDLSPKSAHVMTVFGLANEIDAGGWDPNDWQTLSQRDRNMRQRVVSLGRAERAYREALRFDSHYAMASIRLGRILYLTDKQKEARAALEQGLADTKSPYEQYLGSLFLGAVLQEQKEIAAARQAFEKAVSVAPTSQPAVVALAHFELMHGRPDRARDLAEGFAASSADSIWWAYKDGALDVPGISWLRARVGK